MGLLDKLLNNKADTNETVFTAYAKGRLIPISEVKDDTFAQEMIGKGVAIIPDEGIVKAPVDGKIALVFDTKHAIAIVTASGAEVLLHIGLDTVELDGQGFDVKVKAGSKVKAGQVIATFDKNLVLENGYDPVIPLVITNSDDFSEFNVSEPGNVDEEVVFVIRK